MDIENIVSELVVVILEQEREINRLKRKIDRIHQYIEFYEKYIKERQNGDSNKA